MKEIIPEEKHKEEGRGLTLDERYAYVSANDRLYVWETTV